MVVHKSAPKLRERTLRYLWGEDLIGAVETVDYLSTMNPLLLILVLLLVFGGGGFYFGGPAVGGGGLGLILVICLVIYFLGGFRPRRS